MGGQAAGSSSRVVCPEEEAGAGSRSGQAAPALIQAPMMEQGREQARVHPRGGGIQVPLDVLKTSQLEMFTLFGL